MNSKATGFVRKA